MGLDAGLPLGVDEVIRLTKHDPVGEPPADPRPMGVSASAMSRLVV